MQWHTNRGTNYRHEKIRFFYSDNSILLLGVTYPWGTPELQQEQPDSSLPRHPGLCSRSPLPGDREGLVERAAGDRQQVTSRLLRSIPETRNAYNKCHKERDICAAPIWALGDGLVSVLLHRKYQGDLQEWKPHFNSSVLNHWKFWMFKECRTGSFGSISHPLWLSLRLDWMSHATQLLQIPTNARQTKYIQPITGFCEVCFFPVHK